MFSGLPKLYVPVSSTTSKQANEFLTCLSQDQFVMVDSLEAANVVFTVFYNKLIPASFFNAGGVGVNFHGADISKYRGVGGPIFPIIYGEAELCLTVHRLSPNFDCGKVIKKIFVELSHNETGEEAYEKLSVLCLEYLAQSWEYLLKCSSDQNLDGEIDDPGPYFTRGDLEAAKDLTKFVRALDSDRNEVAYYYDSLGIKHYLRYKT